MLDKLKDLKVLEWVINYFKRSRKGKDWMMLIGLGYESYW